MTLLDFWLEYKDGSQSKVTGRAKLKPVVVTKIKYMKSQDAFGKSVTKPAMRITEGYEVMMGGPEAAEVAKAVGISDSFSNNGVYRLSKNKYKKVQRYLEKTK